MPQVERERRVGEPQHGPRPQRGGLQPGPGGHDDRSGGQHRHQRQRPGQQPRGVRDGGETHDRGQPRPTEGLEDARGNHDPGGDQPQQGAGGELPQPGTQMEVGDRLIGVRQPDREHQRTGEDTAQDTHEDGPRGESRRPGEGHRRHHEHREDQIRLHLDRQRPELLERRDRHPLLQIVAAHLDEMPVLTHGQTGQPLLARRPPLRPGQEDQRRADRAQDHHHRRRDHPAHGPQPVLPQIGQPPTPTGLGHDPQQRAGSEIAGHHEEDVDAAGDPVEPDVVDRDQQRRDGTQPLHPVQVLPLGARRGWRRARDDRSARERSARAQQHRSEPPDRDRGHLGCLGRYARPRVQTKSCRVGAATAGRGGSWLRPRASVHQDAGGCARRIKS